ncbi:MAG: response regulator [Melioribacteraceae bacterium]|nr:response regulator [Melioribacteraceae bacterium]MCF8356107.1 response regulator [Melioribacteraceae bacterium]MCF8395591.1 response regulator [Melioribacteraceae bacterium]MCF8419693.1 response regulator [Melioribacteraceae bacterium]
MGINLRLLLITLLIVSLATVSSTYIFFTLTNTILESQQTKTLLNSANDFIFEIEKSLDETREDFRKSFKENGQLVLSNADSSSVDFYFTLIGDSVISKENFFIKNFLFINDTNRSLKQFISDNPNIILFYRNIQNGNTIYFGKVITHDFLEQLAEKIRAGIALISNSTPVEFSNKMHGSEYLINIIKASKELRSKNNFDIFYQELTDVDFRATYYDAPKYLLTGAKIGFLVYSTSVEAVEYRSTMKMIIVIVLIAGIALSLIFTLLFTTKLRRQINILSRAASITSRGNLSHRAEIITKDEIGKLGEVFNKMLDDIESKERTEKEYTEFITLINQKPTLREISDAALEKIISVSKLTLGALYIVQNDDFRLISTYGITKESVVESKNISIYQKVIEKKEAVEFNFQSNNPVVKTGLAEIKIEYMLIIPIIYNKEVIAIVELAAKTEPKENLKHYIESIQDQLAVGLSNAKAFEQLGDFVDELKKLNDEYQKQNTQITEQNRELIKLHKQLQEKAEELEKQKEKAIELTNVKSKFLASMSHELRTPLNSILGLTDLVLNDRSTLPQTKEKLAVVLRNGKKLLNLINNILDFSKLESDKIDIREEQFFLNSFLEEIKTFIEPLAIEKKLRFEIDFPAEFDYLVNTDKSKLDQILINLLGNAIKFTKKGYVKFSVEIDDSNDIILFIVEDSGIGMSEETQKAVFDEFYQADSGFSRKYGGTGLGLAISNKYTKLLGGNMLLMSEMNKGSKFTLELKNIITEKVSVISENLFPEKEISENYTIESNHSELTALIVEPDYEIQKFIGDYLISNGYKVDFALSKKEAEEKIKSNTFACFIINFKVRESQGIEILFYVKEHSNNTDAPIIFTSFSPGKQFGFALKVFDYSTGINQLNLALDSVKTSLGKKNISVYTVSDSKNISFGENYELFFSRKTSNIFDEITSIRPDVTVFDLSSNPKDRLELIHKLNRSRLTKNIPVIIYFSESITKEEIDNIIIAMDKITEESQYHPLDTLKIIRDRLKLESNTDLRNKLISEDTGDQQSEISSEINETKNRAEVLIVDDDNDTLFTVGEMIQNMGYKSSFARNGIECLLTLRNIKPDLILLDIMMPHMDGFETIKQIRKDPKLDDIPVFALTAHAMLDDKEVIAKNGFDDLITKPIDSKILDFKVKKALFNFPGKNK